MLDFAAASGSRIYIWWPYQKTVDVSKNLLYIKRSWGSRDGVAPSHFPKEKNQSRANEWKEWKSIRRESLWELEELF